jgi:hypothetical protein
MRSICSHLHTRIHEKNHNLENLINNLNLQLGQYLEGQWQIDMVTASEEIMKFSSESYIFPGVVQSPGISCSYVRL